jgi:hypothetical protein
MPTNELGPKFEKGPSPFGVMTFQMSLLNCARWHDRNQWRTICGSKISSATKETPTSSRQDIRAELRYGTIPSWVQKLTRELQMSKQNEQRKREKKRKYSQTSRLENPEKRELHHNHENSCL